MTQDAPTKKRGLAMWQKQLFYLSKKKGQPWLYDSLEKFPRCISNLASSFGLFFRETHFMRMMVPGSMPWFNEEGLWLSRVPTWILQKELLIFSTKNHTQPHVTILNHTQSIFGLSMISLSKSPDIFWSMKNGRDAEVVGGIQQLMLSQRNVEILVVLG